MLSVFSTLIVGCSKEDFEDVDSTGLPTPKANEIYYTTTNGKFLDLSSKKWFNTTVTSHTVKNDSIFVLTFIKDLEEIELHMFNLLESNNHFWLKSMRLPEGIKSIGRGAFWRCDDLQCINIPKSVTKIDGAAFCRRWTYKRVILTIYCEPFNPPTIGEILDDTYNVRIFVPTASVETYKAAKGWRDYADCIEGYDFN